LDRLWGLGDVERHIGDDVRMRQRVLALRVEAVDAGAAAWRPWDPFRTVWIAPPPDGTGWVA
jgi:hypothetical protein